MITVQLNTQSIAIAILLLFFGPIVDCAICELLRPAFRRIGEKLFKYKKTLVRVLTSLVPFGILPKRSNSASFL